MSEFQEEMEEQRWERIGNEPMCLVCPALSTDPEEVQAACPYWLKHEPCPDTMTFKDVIVECVPIENAEP